MNKAPTSKPWYQPWGAARRSSDADAADLGTAFGLDMSLDHWQTEQPLGARPSVPRRAGWLARWATRHKQSL
jgi:hypothetical protein